MTSTTVVASTAVVNDESHPGGDFGSHPLQGAHVDEWKTLAGRLRWVIRTKRVKNKNRWPLDANLARQHVDRLIARSTEAWEKDGQECAFEMPTIVALAEAAKVSTMWLANNEGGPDVPTYARVELDERFPNRAKAAALARAAGCSEQAIADVCAEAAHSNHDYEVKVWLKHFLNRQQMLDDLASGRGLPGRNLSDDEI